MIDKVIGNILKRVDFTDLIENVAIDASYLASYQFENLNEAQSKRCTQCYFHSLLNEKAVTPADYFEDELYN